jgi:acetyl-CoA acetyltransferase
LFTIPVLRCTKTYGLTHEQLAMVSVVQREWAAKNPRATFKAPITVEDVLNARMIAYPFRLLQCWDRLSGRRADFRRTDRRADR